MIESRIKNKSEASTTLFDAQIRKISKKWKQYTSIFLSLYISKLELNKLSTLQIKSIKWDGYILF